MASAFLGKGGKGDYRIIGLQKNAKTASLSSQLYYAAVCYEDLVL